MNNHPSCSKSKQNEDFEDDEIFDDSAFLAKFDNSFKTTTKVSESNINDSINESALNVSALCCDEEISGYDKLTGKTWIYPTNYPVRDYQFNIIRAAILKNTLVSLPTGLGKTFIAAVIMYNFYRWYPLGKIVFTAPTRPLVAQQIDACYNIIAIPPNDTIEMTGHMQANTRKAHWQNKRVFFATPQVIYNDIKSGICPCDKIRCLVIDEAHRARGNYAYCQMVSALDDMGHKIYRMLALSATPGSKVEDVINVVKNLHIAHLELRTEDCIDVAPYSHARRITTVVIELGPELTQLRQQYVEILDWYARRLKQFNILPQNLGNLSKGRIVMLYKEFQSKERGARHPQHNYIMKDFTILIALYHGLELLAQHGSRVFLNFFDEHPEKSWIQADDRLTALLERLRDDLGVNPLSLDRSILPDGTIPEMPKDLCFGHPKFDKLKELMLDHFTSAKHKKQDTRAIVFCEYRESVNLVHCLLLQCRPLINPQMFVGQGASGRDGKTVVSQKQQLRVMRAFRGGACNTLVATCVAEEGLDVGSVDLILCFDISTRSPIRLVQRCGRTGRERGGQVYILVTEGREHQTLMDCMRQRDGLNKKIQQSKEVANNLYKYNPRMVPRDFTPQCQKMFITVQKKQDPKEKSKEDKVKKGQKDLRSMLLGRASSSSSGASYKDSDSAMLISKDEFKELYPEGYTSTTYFSQRREYWTMNKETIKKTIDTEEQEQGTLKLSTWLEWQRTLQKTVNVGHTRDSEILSELLQYSDAKRFEMPPSTQNPSFNTQEVATQKIIFSSPVKTKPLKKKQKVPATKSPAKRDGDIRALFSTATKSTKSYTKLINDLGIQNDGSIPTRMISLLVDLTLDNTAAVKKCYVCQNICECSIILNVRKHKKPPILLTYLNELKLPDIDLIDDFDANSILQCAEGKNKTEEVLDIDKSMEIDNKNCTGNFELEFDFGSQNDLSSPVNEVQNENVSMESDKNFEIGDIEDIFADSSPEEAIENEVKEEKPKEKVALEFFGLDSIDDIFADDDVIELTPDKIPDPISKSDNKQSVQIVQESSSKEQQLSPSILSGRPKTIDPTSPILCSQVRKFQLSTKKDRPQCSTPFSNAKRQLIKESQNNFITEAKNDKSSLMKTSAVDTSNKSMFTITQLVEMINTTDAMESVKKQSNVHIEVNNDRSTSPILLTQADRKKSAHLNDPIKIRTPIVTNKKTESLIILDSDSDSDNTQIYDPEEIYGNTKTENNSTPVNCKRKLDMEDSDAVTASPYFCKKQKLDNKESKPFTLQDKVLAAISSNKCNNKSDSSNDKVVMNFSVSQPSLLSQKENRIPTYIDESRNKLEMLQIFKRDSKLDVKSNLVLNKIPQKPEASKKRKLSFDDSDEDFVIEGKNGFTNHKTQLNDVRDKSTTNHKVRKKNKKGNEFLDMEAALSDDDDNSGDELSDDSVGSIADFICDENVTHHEDIQAVYLKSIKSPIKGGAFKIPELPKKYNREDILSQYVEEDTYEMDSFCVDSHIGLTQVNDVCELELAEIVLEEERRAKKSRRINSQPDDSPVVKRNKPKKRQIDSDSDDSS